MALQRNTKTEDAPRFLFRLAGAATGLFALIAQYYLIIENVSAQGLNYWAETVRFFSYMTIWTNILVTICFLSISLAPDSIAGSFFKKPVVQGGLLIYTFVVAVIYHFLLAGIWSPTGLQYIVDLLLHYAVPLLYLLHWIFFGRKGKQKFRNSILWLAYPLIYVIYALIKGAITNVYPYPFIDVGELGYAVVIRTSILLALAYFLLGLIFIFIDSKFKDHAGE